MVQCYNVPLDTTLCIISSPKVIQSEWRLVIVNKKAVSGSQYRVMGEYKCSSGYPKEALDFANKIASEDWQPDRAYVVDVAKCDDEYKLLEINSFSCSGLYYSDMEPIVRELSKIALEEWMEYNNAND